MYIRLSKNVQTDVQKCPLKSGYSCSNCNLIPTSGYNVSIISSILISSNISRWDSSKRNKNKADSRKFSIKIFGSKQILFGRNTGCWKAFRVLRQKQWLRHELETKETSQAKYKTKLTNWLVDTRCTLTYLLYTLHLKKLIQPIADSSFIMLFKNVTAST